MEVSVLRIGHRVVRDDRVTTHVVLVSRAFGSRRIYMTEVDNSIKETLAKVVKRWGGSDFNVEIVRDWKKVITTWKKNSGIVVHLTMYGINVDEAIIDIVGKGRVLVVVGAQKVPNELFHLADHNVAVGNQPHSEIAALSIFLDRIFQGTQLKRDFRGAKIKIIPNVRGKHVKMLDK